MSPRLAFLRLLGATLVCTLGCSEPGPPGTAIRIVPPIGANGNALPIVVAGLSGTELAAWSSRNESDSSWPRAIRVSVAGPDTIAMAGQYTVLDFGIQFKPRFPLDAGREYIVVVNQRALAPTRSDTVIRTSFRLPGRDLSPTTRVVRILPSAEVLPANQLRLYLEFSAPMGREAGLDFVRLLDDRGKVVPAAFLPLDGDFWNADHTRYTLFLDPGRVKRGILPNEQMGRALRDGRRYVLEVDSAWRDGRGALLASTFRGEIRVGPADFKPITLRAWRVSTPRAGTRDTLVVRFPEPLDHGLLRRALGVETNEGSGVTGDVHVPTGEREWRFAPTDVWRAGAHTLVVLSIIEDLAGNRVDRAFEVDLFERADSTSVPSRFALGFTIR